MCTDRGTEGAPQQIEVCKAVSATNDNTVLHWGWGDAEMEDAHSVGNISVQYVGRAFVAIKIDLLSLLCQGCAKIRLVVCCLCFMNNYYLWIWKYPGVSQKGQDVRMIFCPYHLTDLISHLFCVFGWVDWNGHGNLGVFPLQRCYFRQFCRGSKCYLHSLYWY